MLRSAGSEQLDECETLEAVDGGNDGHIQCRRHDGGPFDLPEHLKLGGAVHLGCLDNGVVHIAQSRHIQHNGLPHRSGEQDEDNAPDGKTRVAEPHDILIDDPQRFEGPVKNTVISIEHPFPHDHDRHGARDRGQIEHTAKKRTRRLVHRRDGGSHPQRKRGDGGNRNHNDEQRIEQRTVKCGRSE